MSIDDSPTWLTLLYNIYSPPKKKIQGPHTNWSDEVKGLDKDFQLILNNTILELQSKRVTFIA